MPAQPPTVETEVEQFNQAVCTVMVSVETPESGRSVLVRNALRECRERFDGSEFGPDRVAA